MTLQRRVDEARRHDGLVVLEGVHALKHAIRFGAVVRQVWSPDPERLHALLADLAPDVVVPVPVEAVPDADFEHATRGGLPSPSLAVADRPGVDAAAVTGTPGRAPVVFLDRPTHLGNLGAVVRVAAAAGADAVITRGRSDPWHPTAVRSAAGLQFALPVGRVEEVPRGPRPLVAIHPDGDRLGEVAVPTDAVLAFGTERAGLGTDVLDAAELVVSIPMRDGVSSLNLATAVAVTLYARPDS